MRNVKDLANFKLLPLLTVPKNGQNTLMGGRGGVTLQRCKHVKKKKEIPTERKWGTFMPIH